MLTIEEIEESPVHGNHYHDAELLRDIDIFLQSTQPMGQKVRALVKLDEVTGEKIEATPEAVEQYLSEV